jgi:DNA polymerase I-like protein with 3'-5' exonuclease and polymerase domains
MQHENAAMPKPVSETRKLAAILVADIVGYSRLAGADEDRILARLRTLRSDLIDPTIAVHHGRVVKRTGDSAIVEFRSTGRNAATGGKDSSGQPLPFIFGTAKWMRGLIKPPSGHGVAYLDYGAEEVAIAAALSHDARLADHYSSGDPYRRFAVAAGLDSRGDYATIRALVKILFLAIGYGMGPASLAAKAGISLAEARELLAMHAATYPDFTRWRANVVDWAYLHGELRTSFDWRRIGCADVATRGSQKRPLSPREELKRWGRGVPPTELMNWPVQSAGSDLTRIVCIAATEAGIELVAPVHDGFLIVSPLDRLAHDVDRFEKIMRQSSEVVTRGLPIRVETKVVRHPGRYMDEKGEAMWNRIMGLYQAKIRKAVA